MIQIPPRALVSCSTMSLFNEIPDRSISRSPTASKLYSRPVASSSVKSELVERPPPHSLHKKKVTAAQCMGAIYIPRSLALTQAQLFIWMTVFAVTRAFHAKLAVQHATHIADLKRDNDSVYRSPRLEEAARMMDWKAALYPNERVYSTRKAAYRPGNGVRQSRPASSSLHSCLFPAHIHSAEQPWIFLVTTVTRTRPQIATTLQIRYCWALQALAIGYGGLLKYHPNTLSGAAALRHNLRTCLWTLNASGLPLVGCLCLQSNSTKRPHH